MIMEYNQKASQQKLVTYTEAKKRLERYCIYQDRCHKEVEQKLREFRLIPEVIEKIIIHLIEHKFLDETRFAQSFARGKFRTKHWGKRRIVNELKQRHISEYNIKKSLKEITEEDYINSFHKLSEKRWKQLKEDPVQRAKQKFVQYLQYRGWESHLIFEKLSELTATK